MSRNLDLMRRAFLSAEGVRGVPTGDDAQLALMRWQDIVSRLMGDRDGGWDEVFATGNLTAADGQRVHAGAGITVALPSGVDVADLSRIHVVGSTASAGSYLYVASKGGWSRTDNLTVGGDNPFGREDDLGLAAVLAVALTGDGGGEVSALVEGLAGQCLTGLSARMAREIEVAAIDGVLALSERGMSHVR
jgi:hypothetical protein